MLTEFLSPAQTQNMKICIFFWIEMVLLILTMVHCTTKMYMSITGLQTPLHLQFP